MARPLPSPLFWVKKKKSEKEEIPAGQAKQNRPLPPPLSQGLATKSGPVSTFYHFTLKLGSKSAYNILISLIYMKSLLCIAGKL